jgi:hypothetical protein
MHLLDMNSVYQISHDSSYDIKYDCFWGACQGHFFPHEIFHKGTLQTRKSDGILLHLFVDMSAKDSAEGTRACELLLKR